MSNTPIRNLEEIPSGSGAPEVVANEMVRGLELNGFFVLKDKDLTTPPASPADGDAYYVPSGASTPWNTRAGQIAYSVGGGAGSWEYMTAANGDRFAFQDELWNVYVKISGTTLQQEKKMDFVDSVLVATTANITLSGEQTLDGVLTSASRVLVKSQTAGSQNGVYVSAAGAWARATDYDQSAEVSPGSIVPVEQGTVNGDMLFMLATNGPITVGTTALTFSRIGGVGAMFNLVEDTSPQLGGDLDLNGFDVLLAGVLAYAPYVKNNSTTSDPTVNDDSTQGYSQNSVWFNTSSGEVFRAISVGVGAAVWPKTSLTIDELGTAALKNTGELAASLFAKSDPDSVAWSKTAAFTAETAQALKIEVDGSVYSIAAATSITMPGSPVAGTDYTIWIHPDDGELEATDSYSTPPATGARRVGGFHYAGGGNASAQAGGNTTAQINEYSFWDAKWRPACANPQGMTLVAGNFWTDIYLLGVDHHVNGTSANGVTIADGSSPPKIPDEFGGDGSSVYSNGNWWNLAEALAAHGKRLPDYQEFAALAYGTSEEVGRGNDPITTGIATTNTGSSNGDEAFTSRWGVMQSTGCLYVWGADFGGSSPDAAVGAWEDITQGRGETYEVDNVVLFGGNWSVGVQAGSRFSYWNYRPSLSGSGFGARGCSDHLRLA